MKQTFGNALDFCTSVAPQFKVLNHHARCHNRGYASDYILHRKNLRMKIFSVTLINFVVIRLKYSEPQVQEVESSIFL